VSGGAGSHGSDVAGQEMLCWQLSSFTESFQRHSSGCTVKNASHAVESRSADGAQLACFAVGWGGLLPLAQKEYVVP